MENFEQLTNSDELNQRGIASRRKRNFENEKEKVHGSTSTSLGAKIAPELVLSLSEESSRTNTLESERSTKTSTTTTTTTTTSIKSPKQSSPKSKKSETKHHHTVRKSFVRGLKNITKTLANTTKYRSLPAVATRAAKANNTTKSKTYVVKPNDIISPSKEKAESMVVHSSLVGKIAEELPAVTEKTRVFGIPLVEVVQKSSSKEEPYLPSVVAKCLIYLLKYGNRDYFIIDLN
eukprot:TRINITY_DN5364_c0_g1_i3.p1 TRINITY_DN5364_c0_g1~~TRINITY_DN5364_c0_g1_i3.p1  ORF type:complete len:234 (+),score=43.38 TRINITY_DN5364_c0_g1_i3:99-800(+)